MSDQAAAFDVRTLGSVTAVQLPAVVRGRLRVPAWPRVGEVRAAVASPGVAVGPTEDGSLLLARTLVDRLSLEESGETQLLVLPAVDPRELAEPDPAAAVRDLMGVTVDEVCAFVDEVGKRLSARLAGAGPAGGLDAASSQVADRLHAATGAAVAGMFDGAAVRRMVDVELAGAAAALDGWVPVDERPQSGVTARMAAGGDLLRASPARTGAPLLRGLPTTQLHITAGNAPAVPASSLLWAWASKGACVLKPAAALVALGADLGAAVLSVDDRHPLARHTTIAYWPGGDRRVEDDLLRAGRFDRTLVWGSADVVRSVAGRSQGGDLIVMRPRHALSLVSATAGVALEDAARRAAADSVVADQQACMSSLLHVVQGSPEEADAYAEVLARVLSRWDERLPHRVSGRVAGELQALRRGLLATSHWRVNGAWPHVRSAVVRLDRDFDLERHPGGRVVLVRSARDVRSVLSDRVVRDVSHVGVSESLLDEGLRDHLVALGVDNVLPLGDAEQGYAGRPHDGMRVLSRLVRWVNA